MIGGFNSIRLDIDNGVHYRTYQNHMFFLAFSFVKSMSSVFCGGPSPNWCFSFVGCFMIPMLQRDGIISFKFFNFHDFSPKLHT